CGAGGGPSSNFSPRFGSRCGKKELIRFLSYLQVSPASPPWVESLLSLLKVSNKNTLQIKAVVKDALNSAATAKEEDDAPPGPTLTPLRRLIVELRQALQAGKNYARGGGTIPVASANAMPGIADRQGGAGGGGITKDLALEALAEYLLDHPHHALGMELGVDDGPLLPGTFTPMRTLFSQVGHNRPSGHGSAGHCWYASGSPGAGAGSGTLGGPRALPVLAGGCARSGGEEFRE
ncbi:unnamed protein product, partial [Discosporangium mesarthrocarpum]